MSKRNQSRRGEDASTGIGSSSRTSSGGAISARRPLRPAFTKTLGSSAMDRSI